MPEDIKLMEPEQRLENMLWSEALHGFPPFGASADQPMVCFSESPPDHLRWLLATRKWPAWGLIFRRQYVYDLGGGPVWHTRTAQWHTLEREQRRWAVRLDTTPGSESDWLFEREWRVPVNADKPFIQLTADNLVGVLVGDPDWQPTRLVETGDHRNASNGERAYPGDLYAQPVLAPGLPPLWETVDLRVYWDRATETLNDALARAGQHT